jgi:hypothetical protein
MVASCTGLPSFHSLFAGVLLVFLCLMVGVLTPYLSLAVCVYALVSLFGTANRVNVLIFASVVLNAGALALLGPGAYSVDARLFGRRVVVVPPSKDSDSI